jgi:hypothetical protein
MAEFGDKYDGDVQAALRGLQKERLTVDVAPLNRNEMKRKWAPVPEEEEHETRKNANSGHGRPAKHREWPYLPPLTPTLTFFYYKKFALHLHHPRRNHHPSQITFLPACKLQRHRVLYVALLFIYRDHASLAKCHVKKSRLTAQSPSPNKLARIPSAPLFRAGPSSPTRPTAASLARQASNTRVPSTSTFKPAIPLPPKTPTYPPPPRWPRKDENMLSINGSPLTNPYELGLEWLADGDTEEEGEGARGAGTGARARGGADVPARMTLRRTASNIIIRSDPSSFVVPSAKNTSNNLNNHHQAAERPRNNSNSQSQTQPQLVRSRSVASNPDGHMAARVAFPTRDGHLLEFDPLLTSPGALDKLEGITDSAKKQAKEDMSKLVQAAVAKWTVK